MSVQPQLFKDKNDIKEQLEAMCLSARSKTFEECTDRERFLCLARLIAQKARRIEVECHPKDEKQVYYFSLEFLLGPLLDNYLLNFGIRDFVEECLKDMGSDLETLCAKEDAPGLGKGGLGRLAACFLDSMAALGIAGNRKAIRNRNGLIRQ